MILNLIWAVQAETIRRLSLDHLVYEVRCLDRPALGTFISLDLYLFGQNVISDFLTTLSDVGPLTLLMVYRYLPFRTCIRRPWRQRRNNRRLHRDSSGTSLPGPCSLVSRRCPDCSLASTLWQYRNQWYANNLYCIRCSIKYHLHRGLSFQALYLYVGYSCCEHIRDLRLNMQWRILQAQLMTWINYWFAPLKNGDVCKCDNVDHLRTTSPSLDTSSLYLRKHSTCWLWMDCVAVSISVSHS
jgi:hypothetical protein